ncbi:MAG: type II toxin-antitoxin system RelE/ParE family toxin [Mucilaginibacter sp.]
MNFEIFWSDEAVDTFASIVLFIENKWSEREAGNFVRKTQKTLTLISGQPYMFKESVDHNIRQEYTASLCYKANVSLL